MGTVYFPAIIERGAHGFSVFFPDLPGCASGGDTIDETARNAEEALSGHLALMAKDGDALPYPTPIDLIEKDAEVDEAARVLVRAELAGESVRLNISLDKNLLARIDAAAERQGMTRSGFIAEASAANLTAAHLTLTKTLQRKFKEVKPGNPAKKSRMPGTPAGRIISLPAKRAKKGHY